ncbi:MAG: hypothetical protein IPI81_07835 [Flavobacteriales bacterium]|nr:hypothetical protein [Flavobacteriales bacterium]
MRGSLPLLLLLLPIGSLAQGGAKAAPCFWSNDFETGIPLDWTISQVERQTPEGVGLGEFVPAFTLGTASTANVGGFLPVIDLPIGNRFIMANDDASPCNCDMGDVSLTTGPIDLSGRSNVMLECRVFHEMTLGSGDVRIEGSTNGTDWTEVWVVPAMHGQWNNLYVDLAGFDGSPSFQLRFRWSDNGEWSSGFALDDLCLRERFATDLSIVDVRMHDLNGSAFNQTVADLEYTAIPLEQARPLVVSVVVMNRGTSTVQNIGAQVDVSLAGNDQGNFLTTTVIDLAPGERDTLVISTDWTASAVGIINATATLTMGATDEDTSDNSGIATMRITGAGWDDGYSAMSCDDRIVQGMLGSELNFIAANRMEVVNAGSHAQGISAVIGVDSQVGEYVRAILMDGNFALIDTSTRHAITQADIDLGFGGGSIYLPLSLAPGLPVGDVMVGLQRLSGTGRVSVGTSGTGSVGASAFMAGTTFDITWTTATPMVRLHLSELGVGVPESSTRNGPILFPQPANDRVHIRVPTDGPAIHGIRIMDNAGKVLFNASGINAYAYVLETGSFANGPYILEVLQGVAAARERLLIIH